MAFLFVAIPNLFFNPVKSNCAQSPARANITRINECVDLPSPDKGKSGDSYKKISGYSTKSSSEILFFYPIKIKRAPFSIGGINRFFK